MLISILFAAALSVPGGWTARTSGGVTTLTPNGLAAGELAVIEVHPAESAPDLRKWSDAAWAAFLRGYTDPRSVPVSEGKNNAAALRTVVYGASMVDPDGGELYVAFEAVGQSGRTQPVLFVAGSLAAYQKYADVATKLVNAMTSVGPVEEKTTFVSRLHPFRLKSPAAPAAASAAATVASARPTATTTAAAKPATGALDLRSLTERTGEIETIAFYSRMQMGVGGAFMLVPTPLVLFKNGEALRDMKQLTDPAGLAANHTSHEHEWTKWRRNGSAIEELEGTTWKKISYTKTYDRLPKGFKLSGSYEHISGTGNTAFGGGASIAAWSDLVFDRDGTFHTGGGISGSIEDANSRAIASGTAASQHGTYEVNGYVLTFHYSDGHDENRMITTDASDTSTIWLDGLGYTRSK